MPAKKKKAPEKIGGYSYDKVVKNKDKNGRPIFFKKENGKKIRTSAAAYKKVQDTKQYYKNKFNKDWQNKYKDAQKTLKSTLKDAKKKEDTKQRKEKEIEQSRNKTVIEKISTFANSMATDIETQFLRYGNAKLFLDGAKFETNKSTLIDVRLFFSELADLFYERWHEKTNEGQKLPSPNIMYNWNIQTTEINKTKQIVTDVNVTLNETTFTFDGKYFYQLMKRLFKTYFG